MHGNKCMEINRVGGYSTRQLPWMSMTDETVHRVLSVDVDHKTVDCVDGWWMNKERIPKRLLLVVITIRLLSCSHSLAIHLPFRPFKKTNDFYFIYNLIWFDLISVHFLFYSVLFSVEFHWIWFIFDFLFDFFIY